SSKDCACRVESRACGGRCEPHGCRVPNSNAGSRASVADDGRRRALFQPCDSCPKSAVKRTLLSAAWSFSVQRTEVSASRTHFGSMSSPSSGAAAERIGCNDPFLDRRAADQVLLQNPLESLH